MTGLMVLQKRAVVQVASPPLVYVVPLEVVWVVPDSVVDVLGLLALVVVGKLRKLRRRNHHQLW